MLGGAARALDAQRFGLDVTGQNIANVNTPGFARRTIEFAEVPPRDAWSAGGGVDVEAVTAARAPLLEARLRQENPVGARERTIADQLSIVETRLGSPGASLDAAMSRFYNAYGTLALNPVSGPARHEVIVEGQALATAFRDMADQLAATRRSADKDIRDLLDQINALAKEVAAANGEIVELGSPAVETARDRQAVVLETLTQLLDVNVIQRSDGGVDVSLGNGRALVVGTSVFELSASTTGPSGFAAILTSGADVITDVTAEITGGQIGGLLQIRDVLVPGYAARLDALAHGVASGVNGLTTTGFDLNGAAGSNFFVPPGAVAGAAAAMAVNPLVASDGNLVVAAAAATAGNNEVAKAVAALQDAPIAGGSATPVDTWGDLVYRVAADARSANQAAKSRDEIMQQLRTLRDQTSGISLDEEAAMLMRFQRAYEANARFFTVADEALELLIQLVRV
jgi:flagellar hook-associated protein 1 FlgK